MICKWNNLGLETPDHKRVLQPVKFRLPVKKDRAMETLVYDHKSQALYPRPIRNAHQRTLVWDVKDRRLQSTEAFLQLRANGKIGFYSR